MGDLLAETLAALAAAGGGAVVQAAGTDAWYAVRQRVAELFGRGDAERGRAELERLDRTARALEPGAATDPDREQSHQEGFWQGRFEALLESLDAGDRERTAQDLRALLAFVAGEGGDTALATGNALARDGGTAVTGVKRSDGGRAARAVDTGDAEATGPGSTAVSGIAAG
ncbi:MULTISPECIES: hypothetical protein [unclassified Streptomyces]|uniref:hypothetical protein n=1 Tax=unclassified Streptomyces TaxID=2593676 RepID=UPI0037023B1E